MSSSSRRPDHHRVAVDRHAVAEVVTRSAVARGQLGNLRPAGGEVAGCDAREHVRGPAVDRRRRPFAPTTTVSPSIDTLEPKSSFAAPSSAVSLATCVQPEARSPAVSRVNTYADPLLDPCRRRHTPRSPPCRRRSTRCSRSSHSQRRRPAVSLATCVQPEARSPAVLRVNTYADPLLDPLSSSLAPRSPSCRRRSTRSSRTCHLAAPSVPRSAWQPASSRRRGRRPCTRVNTYADPLLLVVVLTPRSPSCRRRSTRCCRIGHTAAPSSAVSLALCRNTGVTHAAVSTVVPSTHDRSPMSP